MTFGVLSNDCPNCLALREEVRALRRQLGQEFEKGHLGAVSDAFHVSPTEARILLTIYYRDDWTPTVELEKHLNTATNALQVHIGRIRGKIGKRFVESRWGFGYRLSPEGRERLTGVLR